MGGATQVTSGLDAGYRGEPIGAPKPVFAPGGDRIKLNRAAGQQPLANFDAGGFDDVEDNHVVVGIFIGRHGFNAVDECPAVRFVQVRRQHEGYFGLEIAGVFDVFVIVAKNIDDISTPVSRNAPTCCWTAV